MATCKYCGRRAGIFRRQHPDCLKKRLTALQTIPGLVLKGIASEMSATRFLQLLMPAAQESFIGEDEVRSMVSDSIRKDVSHQLENSLISEERQHHLYEFLDAFVLDETTIDNLLTKNHILNALQEGRIPQCVEVKGQLPLTLSTKEVVLWIFNKIATGTRSDPSNNIANGTSTPYIPKGTAKDTLKIKSEDIGLEGDLVVTNRGLHFISSTVAPFRIKIANIVNVEVFTNGVVIEDGSEKQQFRVLILDDPWFAANLFNLLIERAKA
jgi:hypothetical protein